MWKTKAKIPSAAKATPRGRLIDNNDGDDLWITAFGIKGEPGYPARFASVDQFLALHIH